VHPRGFQHLSRARGPQSTRARGGDGKGVTCQALVQSWFLFRVSNSQLSFSCVSEALFFKIRFQSVRISKHFDISTSLRVLIKTARPIRGDTWIWS
jgi:hypothetical protein